MVPSILYKKDAFVSLIVSKLAFAEIDYAQKHLSLTKANRKGARHLEAGVVLLINYKASRDKSEYVFQLIKRSEKVAQGGDISCPGGIFSPGVDHLLAYLLKTGLVSAFRTQKSDRATSDKKTSFLVNLFLANALREAWEEIGLNPINAKFLGALPSYSLSSFTRTIFPLVCLTGKPFTYRLSAEVEKILEVPVSSFFQSENYALLQVQTPTGIDAYDPDTKFPCLTIPDDSGNVDILWGATFQIITDFLRLLFGNTLPAADDRKTIKKIIGESYLSGNKKANGRIENK